MTLADGTKTFYTKHEWPVKPQSELWRKLDRECTSPGCAEEPEVLGTMSRPQQDMILEQLELATPTEDENGALQH